MFVWGVGFVWESAIVVCLNAMVGVCPGGCVVLCLRLGCDGSSTAVGGCVEC